MTQRVSQKAVVVLNKGLNTEAGELTFPEGASVDELNFQLERDGSRRRRLGLKFESGFQEFGAGQRLSTFLRLQGRQVLVLLLSRFKQLVLKASWL
jgi:hypothetical protein